MVSDWVKMRSDLYRDPKVCAIADHLWVRSSALSDYVNQNCQCDMTVTRNVLRNAAVGCLVAIWGVARHRGKRSENDLVLKNTHISVIDDIADLPGFGAAMLAVEWVKELDNSLIFPNFFEEFNVDPDEEKNRKNAERQKKHREKVRNVLRNVTTPLQSNTREEKRRDKDIRTANGKPNLKTLTDLGVEEQIAVDWLEVRKAKRVPLTHTAIASLKREAEKAGITVAQAVLICAKRSWQGFNASWEWRDSKVTNPQKPSWT